MTLHAHTVLLPWPCLQHFQTEPAFPTSLALRRFDTVNISKVPMLRDAGTEGGRMTGLWPTAHRLIHVADGHTYGGTSLV